MEFKSEEEFQEFCDEMLFIESEMKMQGRAFNWDIEAEKFYPEFIRYKDNLKDDSSQTLKAGEDDIEKILSEKNGNSTGVVKLSQFNNRVLPKLPDELIGGILRKQRKMLLAGPSKAGKTGLLMELALALASGSMWFEFPCKRCHVLYIDLENDIRTSIDRFFRIMKQISGQAIIPEGLGLLNWRGKTKPLDQLKNEIVDAARGYDVIILDPMYKIITGDENSATDMAYFCRQVDDIIEKTGATVIYCHHHSKGSQGQKKAMDRASGSGVFARDADALLDIIELGVTEKYRSSHKTPEGASAWRMEFTLREFAPHEPINFWHDYPLHILDKGLSELYVQGSREANLAASRKREGKEDKAARAHQVLQDIFTVLDPDGEGIAELSKAAEHAKVSTKTIQRYVKLFPEEYANPANSGMIVRIGTKAAGRYGM